MRLYAKFEGAATIVSIFRAILARFVFYRNGPKRPQINFVFFSKQAKKGPFLGKIEKKIFHHFRNMILGKVEKCQNDM